MTAAPHAPPTCERAPRRFTYDYVLRLLTTGGCQFDEAHRIATEVGRVESVAA